jgi:acetyltransferase-like isoleucine patch superfamily enzyme
VALKDGRRRYLAVFQPVCFMSEGFQRLVLLAFGARLGPGALVTSRTIIREPHHVRIGAATLVGEFVHLACSYQPRPRLLVVDDIVIGDGVLVGAHSLLAPGARVGNRCIIEHAVSIGAHVTIGDNVHVGAGAPVHRRAGRRRGDDRQGCIIPAGSMIPAARCFPTARCFPAQRARQPA